MAIEPQRRENLLSEATAFERRLLLELPVPQAWLEPAIANPIASMWSRDFVGLDSWQLFLGWHKRGGWSIYFEQQPVLQFNSQNQLRRLYASGQRYAAERGRLQLLQRDRLGGRVQFQPSLLLESDERLVLASCKWFLATVGDLLIKGHYSVVGQHPAAEDGLVREALTPIAVVASELTIAQSPQHG